MSLTTSTVTPLIVHTPRNQNRHDQIMITNPNNEPFPYESRVRYEQPTVVRRTYHRAPKPNYRYTIEQDGRTYRCCEWCRYCCTRTCSICDFCDRIISCPLLCFILSALFLLLLFIALLTLFGLHPNINSARRYYGIISTLSIYNRTKYIFNLDQICSTTSIISNCLDIVTSTGYNIVSTTITVNGTVATMNFSYILLISCLTIYCIYQKVCFYLL